MKVYKLVSQRKDGSLGPLFIGCRMRIDFGVWYDAEFLPRKGFFPRKGWHCCMEPKAPHLVMNPKKGHPRVWVVCEVENFKYIKRPELQGGLWVLAQRIKFVKLLSEE